MTPLLYFTPHNILSVLEWGVLFLLFILTAVYTCVTGKLCKFIFLSVHILAIVKNSLHSSRMKVTHRIIQLVGDCFLPLFLELIKVQLRLSGNIFHQCKWNQYWVYISVPVTENCSTGVPDACLFSLKTFYYHILFYKPMQSVSKPVDILPCAASLDINKAVRSPARLGIV